MVILEINGIPYQVIAVNADGVPELRLINSTGAAYSGLKSPILSDNTVKVFTLPADFAECGLSGHVISDEAGILSLLTPQSYLADLAGGSSLAQVITRVNLLQTLLIAAKILQPQVKICTPSPASCYTQTCNSQITTPSPATCKAGTA